jgi:hypothetical protein
VQLLQGLVKHLLRAQHIQIAGIVDATPRGSG